MGTAFSTQQTLAKSIGEMRVYVATQSQAMEQHNRSILILDKEMREQADQKNRIVDAILHLRTKLPKTTTTTTVHPVDAISDEASLKKGEEEIKKP
jgi:glycerol-3-phosphate cytidylyltransferase-like family protein